MKMEKQLRNTRTFSKYHTTDLFQHYTFKQVTKVKVGIQIVLQDQENVKFSSGKYLVGTLVYFAKRPALEEKGTAFFLLKKNYGNIENSLSSSKQVIVEASETLNSLYACENNSFLTPVKVTRIFSGLVWSWMARIYLT